MNRMPGTLQAIAIMTVVNGALNILWGLSLILGLLATILGVLCLPLAALPLVLGIVEVVCGAQALSGSGEMRKTPQRGIAVLQIVNVISGNVISLVIGIICLVLYESEDVRAYYEAPHSKGDR